MSVLGFASGNAEVVGEHVITTSAPFINGVSQAGQSRWLIQDACLEVHLLSCKEDDKSFTTADGYAISLTGNRERKADGTYETAYFGWYYSNDISIRYQPERPTPPVITASRKYIVPPVASSFDEETKVTALVDADGIGGFFSSGDATAVVTTYARTNLLGGGGGGGSIIP